MTRSVLRLLCLTPLLVAAACGGSAPVPASSTEATPPVSAPAPVAPSQPSPTEAGGHAHSAPHGGALVEIGDHFAFLEFVVDAEAGRVTMYVLDGEAEKPIRLTQKTVTLTVSTPIGIGTLELQGKANTLTGETVGDTSEFVAIHASLKGATKLDARVRELGIKGQTVRDLEVHWPDGHD